VSGFQIRDPCLTTPREQHSPRTPLTPHCKLQGPTQRQTRQIRPQGHRARFQHPVPYTVQISEPTGYHEPTGATYGHVPVSPAASGYIGSTAARHSDIDSHGTAQAPTPASSSGPWGYPYGQFPYGMAGGPYPTPYGMPYHQYPYWPMYGYPPQAGVPNPPVPLPATQPAGGLSITQPQPTLVQAPTTRATTQLYPQVHAL
jgi:hypothetical protein